MKKIIISLGVLLVVGMIFLTAYRWLAARKLAVVLNNNQENSELEAASLNIPIEEAVPREELVETGQEIAPEEIEEEKLPAKEKTVSVEEEPVVKKKVEDISIKNELITFGFGESAKRLIDTIILHSSYNALGGNPYDIDKLIDEYKEYGVAPHYVIDREGKVYRLVEDKNIAYHAGESQTPDGRTGVNNFSIGIEIMNTQAGKCTDKQYTAINNLIGMLKNKYKIKYVLGHKDIAPKRKDDPWGLDWKRIAVE